MPKTIDKVIKDEFGFLIEEYNYRLQKCKKITGGVDILFVSDKCGVSIMYEFREAYIFVTLYKLQNGKLVHNPRPISAESLITGYSLDDILSIKAPNAVVKPAYKYGEKSEFYDKDHGLTRYVSRFARNLKDHASDILMGDFTIFETLEPIVKKRAEAR